MLTPAPLGEAAVARLRALRFPDDRDDFVAARLLAAHVLREAGSDPVAPAELRQRCDDCGGPHGRPLPVGGFRVSWSHSHGWVAAAASRSRLGVDVEAGPGSVLDEALSPSERELLASADRPGDGFRLAWTTKEALAKAGAGRLDDFGATTVLTGVADARSGSIALRASSGGLRLSTRTSGEATATAATEGPARWLRLGSRGDLVPFDRAVGGAA